MGWSEYTDYLIGQRLSQLTIRRYLRWLREADEWLKAQGTSLDVATATEVASFAAERVTNSASSRRQASVALKHYWEMTDRDRPPVRAIRVPPTPEYECRAITELQARDVVKAATGWWPEGAVVLCGMYLALRRFEIAKMEWARFDTGAEWYRVTGKYDKTNSLPVHPHLRAELEGRRGGSPWVFPGRFDDRHIATATVWAWVERVGQAAGIPHLEPHELRHTALATANDVLGNLRAVQTFARHSKPSTTSLYTRTTKTRLREVSDALDYLA
jgi:integrase